MELPESPGPAAYEVARGMDLLPQWAPDTVVPYGKRTGQRPPCRNPTASNVGPGEYTAHHTMQPYKPAPLFGHPLRTFMKDATPAPGDYVRSTSVGKDSCGQGFFPQPGYSMTSRPEPLKSDEKPGPGTYDPDHTAVVAESYCATFGRSERVHESDLIDPDEPPGPGAHKVRQDPKASDKPSVGLPLAQRIKQSEKQTPGSGTPGPGMYPAGSTISKRSVGMHLPLPRPPRMSPGPCEYSPDLALTREASLAWASPARTSKRTPFGSGFKEEPSGSHVEVKMEKPVAGPKWSMGCRRDHISTHKHLTIPIVPPDPENHHGMYGAYSSVTPRRASSRTSWKPPRAAAGQSVCDSEN